MLIKEKERRKKIMELYSLVTDFSLCPKQAVWGILNFTFCRVHARKNVLQQIFPTNLFTSLFPLSNAGSIPALVFSWLLSSPSFTHIKYKFLLAKLSEHFPEQVQIKYLIGTKTVFLTSTQTWDVRGCLLLLKAPDNPYFPLHILFNFN